MMYKTRLITLVVAAFVFLGFITCATFAEVFAGEPSTIKWKYPIESSLCFSPAVGYDNTIYVPSGGNHLLALNPDGTLKWSFDAGGWVNTPSVDANGNIYFESQPNGVYALKADGTFLWNYNPTGSFPGGDCNGHIAIGQNNTIYATAGGGILHAIDASNGQAKWTSTTAGVTPAISSDGKIYSTGPSSLPMYLFALDNSDGSITMQSAIPVPPYNWPPIIGSSGDIYVIGQGMLYAFNPDGTNKWERAFTPGFSYFYSRPVTGSDGTVYFAFYNNSGFFLQAMNPDGTDKWGFNASDISLPSDIVIGNDGNLYVASASGVIAFDSQGLMLFYLQYSNGFFSVDSYISSVMGHDGTLYVIGEEQDGKAYLYAIHTSSTEPALSSWPMMGANAQHTHVANNLSSFMLPDTGQTTCYDGVGTVITCPAPGQPLAQDGSYTINPLSYTDNGDGTVTDNNTGLVWQKEDDGNTYKWYEASGTYDSAFNPTSQDVCGSLNLGGYSDWRLPTKKELMSIVDYGIPLPGPTINATYFPNTKSFRYYHYWSSTTAADYPDGAWFVGFYVGYVGYANKGNGYYVRCVRGEQMPGPNLIDNGNGTVTDTRAGLIWQQGEQGYMIWEQALNSCEGLNLANKTDWRLPNIKELESITDDTKYNPAIDIAFFPNAYASEYWSSTTYAYEPVFAWYVYFGSGYVGYGGKGSGGCVRCVRGGQVGDLDNDSLPDLWEQQYFGDLVQGSNNDDYDHDELTNLQEYQLGTDPTKWDTDGDGVDDGTEVEWH